MLSSWLECDFILLYRNTNLKRQAIYFVLCRREKLKSDNETGYRDSKRFESSFKLVDQRRLQLTRFLKIQSYSSGKTVFIASLKTAIVLVWKSTLGLVGICF